MPKKPKPKPPEPAPAKPKCGGPVWRCTKCNKTVAGDPGGKKPAACKSRTCDSRRIVRGKCGLAAGWGTGHPGNGPCRRHGGTAGQIERAAEHRRDVAEAEEQIAKLGVPVDITDDEALYMLRATAHGNVKVLERLVGDLGTDQLYSDLYHESGSPTGRALPHVLYVMWSQERDRLANLVIACAKLGLDERRIRIDEARAERILTVIQKALAKVGLTPEQTATFRQAVADELRAG